jgi:rhodanese-related sulfurtransferase
MPVRRISAGDAYKLFSSGRPVVFLDVRNPTAWAESNQKIPGAVRIPVDQLDSRLNELDRSATIFTYCT